jgi:hypothetical protein
LSNTAGDPELPCPKSATPSCAFRCSPRGHGRGAGEARRRPRHEWDHEQPIPGHAQTGILSAWSLAWRTPTSGHADAPNWHMRHRDSQHLAGSEASEGPASRASGICARHVAKGMAGRRIACQRLLPSANTSIRIRMQGQRPRHTADGATVEHWGLTKASGPLFPETRHWSTRGADRQAASSAIDFACPLSTLLARWRTASKLEARSSELGVRRS